MYKQYKTGIYILFAAAILFFAENFYFGWNETAQSGLEKAIDNTVLFMYGFGFMLIVYPNVKLYEKKLRDADIEKEIKEEVLKELERKIKAEEEGDTDNMCYCEACIERRALEAAQKDDSKSDHGK